MVSYFLGKWSVVGGRWSVVGGRWSLIGVTVVGGWSVGGGFVLRPLAGQLYCIKRSSCFCSE